MTLYFIFLRRITPETKVRKQRERFSQTVIAPQTARPAKQTETARNEPDQTESTEAMHTETVKSTQTETSMPSIKAEAKPSRKKPIARVRKAEPVAAVNVKKSYKGQVPFCPKYLGYLGTLPKGSPYPDQCLGCRKVVSCIGMHRGEAIESLYIEEEVTQ